MEKKQDYIINSYIDLFLHSQQYYGSKYSEDFTFKMFVSEREYSDIIFQDATQQLVEIPLHKRNYHEYLGYDFIQAMKMVDCTAAATTIKLNNICIFVIMIVLLLFKLQE